MLHVALSVYVMSVFAVLPEAVLPMQSLCLRDRLQSWALRGVSRLHGPLSQSVANSCSSPDFLMIVQLDAFHADFCRSSSYLAPSCR